MYFRLIFIMMFVFNYVGASNPQNSELLHSINAALSYYIKNYEEPFFNILFGTMITKGRLLRFAGINEVDKILDKCNLIMEKLYRKEWALTPYADKFMKMLSEVFDQNDLNPTVINYTLTYNLTGGHPTIKESDECLISLLEKGYASNMCNTAMTDSTAVGYSLSHQTIYFAIRYSLFPWEKMKNKHQIRKLCSKMYAEQNAFWKGLQINRYLKDLLTEQRYADNRLPFKMPILHVMIQTPVIVKWLLLCIVELEAHYHMEKLSYVVICGSYRGFTTEINLQLIRSLQNQNGCFRFDNGPKSMENCNQHLSAVCVAGLATFYSVLII